MFFVVMLILNTLCNWNQVSIFCKNIVFTNACTLVRIFVHIQSTSTLQY